jgi:hypothetical protein
MNIWSFGGTKAAENRISAAEDSAYADSAECPEFGFGVDSGFL